MSASSGVTRAVPVTEKRPPPGSVSDVSTRLERVFGHVTSRRSSDQSVTGSTVVGVTERSVRVNDVPRSATESIWMANGGAADAAAGAAGVAAGFGVVGGFGVAGGCGDAAGTNAV